MTHHLFIQLYLAGLALLVLVLRGNVAADARRGSLIVGVHVHGLGEGAVPRLGLPQRLRQRLF